MKFKKLALITTMFGAMTMANVSHAAALSDSAIINFKGVFQNTTCNININNVDVSGNNSVDVLLGTYSTDTITTDTNATTAVPFAVDFSGCGSIQSANITFAGTQTAAGLFDVTGSNKDNVGVGINTSASTGGYLAIGDNTLVNIENGTGSTNFYARYVKIGAVELVEGQSNATTTIDITYS